MSRHDKLQSRRTSKNDETTKPAPSKPPSTQAKLEALTAVVLALYDAVKEDLPPYDQARLLSRVALLNVIVIGKWYKIVRDQEARQLDLPSESEGLPEGLPRREEDLPARGEEKFEEDDYA